MYLLRRHIVGLAGPPGAGKSTLASEVVRRVNKLWPQNASSLDSQVTSPDVAAVLPMDGYHLYRSQLDAMEVSLPSDIIEFCFSSWICIAVHYLTHGSWVAVLAYFIQKTEIIKLLKYLVKA